MKRISEQFSIYRPLLSLFAIFFLLELTAPIHLTGFSPDAPARSISPDEIDLIVNFPCEFINVSWFPKEHPLRRIIENRILSTGPETLFDMHKVDAMTVFMKAPEPRTITSTLKENKPFPVFTVFHSKFEHQALEKWALEKSKEIEIKNLKNKKCYIKKDSGMALCLLSGITLLVSPEESLKSFSSDPDRLSAETGLDSLVNSRGLTVRNFFILMKPSAVRRLLPKFIPELAGQLENAVYLLLHYRESRFVMEFIMKKNRDASSLENYLESASKKLSYWINSSRDSLKNEKGPSEILRFARNFLVVLEFSLKTLQITSKNSTVIAEFTLPYLTVEFREIFFYFGEMLEKELSKK